MTPTYPGTYPKNLKCSYKFIGMETQIIILSFHKIVLDYSVSEISHQSIFVIRNIIYHFHRKEEWTNSTWVSGFRFVLRRCPVSYSHIDIYYTWYNIYILTKLLWLKSTSSKAIFDYIHTCTFLTNSKVKKLFLYHFQTIRMHFNK